MEPAFFKGEEAEQLIAAFPDCFDPALPPRPHLRSDQEVHRDVHPFQVPCQAQMEVGAVRQNGRGRWVLSGVANQLPIFTIDSRQMTDDFGQTHYRQTSRIDDRLHTLGLQPGPGTPIECRIWIESSQRMNDARGIQIARSFSCRDQNFHLL